MNWVTVTRIVRLGVTNFWRNRWLSLVATTVIMLTLLVISIFSLLGLGIYKATQEVRSRIDLAVYIDDKATEEEINELKRSLEVQPNVREVTYRSKEEALQIFERLQGIERIRGALSPQDNPLPRSLQVKPTDPAEIASIADSVKQSPLAQAGKIRRLSYDRNSALVDRLVGITRFITILGALLSTIFLFVSVLVIFNTIRLAIFARRDEIEIMRLVGASDAFVKGPFLLEGALYGLIAAFFSFAMMNLSIVLIAQITRQTVRGIEIPVQSFFEGYLWPILAGQILLGLLVGTVFSYWAVKKYIRV